MADSKLVQTILYAGGPFFVYPWKPLLNVTQGSTYQAAYTHFRRDHQYPGNLAAHMACLYYQLLSNFALLTHADEYVINHFPRLLGGKVLGQVGPVSTLCSVGWAAQLVFAPSPLVVKVGSLASLTVAQLMGTTVSSQWIPLLLGQGLLEAFAINVLQGKEAVPSKMFVLKTLCYAAVRTAVAMGFLRIRGSLVAYSKPIALALMLFQGFRSYKKPVPDAFSPFGVIGWVFAVLTNQPAIYFWSCAFTASIMQGTSHKLSGEQATLVALNNGSGVNLTHEVSHTGYFPNLLLHSVYQSFTGRMPFFLQPGKESH